MKPVLTEASRALVAMLRGAIKAYRLLISPWFGSKCRFEPSCSAYALQALQTHGLARGGFYAARRICRCHPWGSVGYDPVPPRCEAVMPAPPARPFSGTK